VNAIPPDPFTAMRLRLFRNGYRPIPVSDPNPILSTGGKAPLIRDWPNVAASATEATIEGWATRPRNHHNTGLLCGELIGLDLDLPHSDLAEQIGRMADEMLGTTPLHRIGKAPKSLRCYRAETPMSKLETAELVLPCGMGVQVEAMGAGQQVVAYGIHPGTLRPYEWPLQSPLDVPLADLPVLAEATLRGFLAAAEAVLRAAGGRTRKEIEATEKEQAEAEAAANAPHPQAEPEPEAGARPNAKGDKNAFFREVNRRALGNIGPWFCAVFPNAEEQTGGGKTHGCWRVSSADLGRSLEEDVSMHPVDGGQDFGTDQSCSPIDVVIEWGGAATAKDAAFFICDKLGIAPADCGWKESGQRAKREDRPATGLPLIQVVAGELHNVVTAAEDAILKAGEPIYQRGHALVRPATREVPAARGRTTLAAGLAEMTAHALMDVLSRVAEWEKYDARAQEFVRINPPKLVADILLSRKGQWRLPHVAGVVTTPTMRADGSILSAPGYDPATRLYHAADPTLRLHPAVHDATPEEAANALRALERLLTEFPFVTTVVDGKPLEVSRAVALSALITPVVRGALPVAPAHAFRANTAGSGKSYLADVSSAIATGRPCPVISAAPGDEAETEKRITALLLAGFPIISLDNVNGELGGDLLCQAIERPLVRVRPLGRSEIVEIESRSTIFCTGNNLRVRGDMVRRTLPSDLDAGVERPEERTFRDDPVAIILANRGHYVSAALIVVRAYLLARSPGQLPPIASFEDWSNLVRSALVWLGCADPVLSMKAARDDDPELGELREVMAAWRDAFGADPTTCRVAIEAAGEKVAKADEEGDRHTHAPLTEPRHPGLHDALARVAGFRGNLDPIRLGRWLLGREGRIVGMVRNNPEPLPLRFRRDGISSGAARWRLEQMPAEGGKGG